MKNPFKKSSIVDTVVNVGIGGAANVAVDYAFSQIEALASLSDTWKNAIKIAAGVVGGTMVSGSYAKYVRPALDGLATVGASNLIASYLPTGESAAQEATAGMPFIGKVMTGQPGFNRAVKGTGKVPFQGK